MASIGVLPWLAMAGLAVAVGLYALTYIDGDPSRLPAVLRANFLAHPVAFLTHTTAAGLALLVAPFQVLPALRRRWPRVHRWTGRVYVVACLLGGIAGLRIAFGTAYGPVAAAGFATLALAWLATTTLGFQAARAGDVGRHRAWMLRSVALTFAAVTLRLQLWGAVAGRIDFDVAYPAIAWLCWIPNLVVIEWWLRRRVPARTARRAMAPATRPPSGE